MKRKFETTFVAPRPRSWLSWLFDGLFARPQPQAPRRPPTQPIPIYHGIPDHVGAFKKRASDAISLLRLMVEQKPASRRAWIEMGRSDRRWRKARRVLVNAKVMNQEGELLYSGRDAELRLAVYLDGIERKCRESGRYVPP